MFNFTITTVELIGWTIIYIVGLICVALGLGCVIRGERQKRFWMQHQIDNIIEMIGTLEQRVIDLESHAMWIDEFSHSKDRSFSIDHPAEFQLQDYADYVGKDGTPVIDGKPIADATPGTVVVAEKQAYVYNGNSWGTIDSLGWDKIVAADSLPTTLSDEDGNVTKVITPSETDHS